MIKVITKENELIGKFGGYIDFHHWLIGSAWGVVDYGKPLWRLQRDGGTVIVEPIDTEYLRKLNIIND